MKRGSEVVLEKINMFGRSSALYIVMEADNFDFFCCEKGVRCTIAVDLMNVVEWLNLSCRNYFSKYQSSMIRREKGKIFFFWGMPCDFSFKFVNNVR